MRFSTTASAGLLALLTTGCTQNLFFSPEALLKRDEFAAQCPEGTTRGIVEILRHKHNWGAGVVLYRTNCYGQDSNNSYKLTGDSTYVREDLQWQPRGGSETERKPEALLEAKKEYIDFSYDFLNQSTQAVYGHIFSPEVETIEVVLENGELLQDDGKNDSFIVFIPSGHSLRELRVLDSTNNVLLQKDFR